jgi:acetate kinase
MVILTLNCGSSSVKYQVYDWKNKAVMATGLVERVGTDESRLEHKALGKEEYEQVKPAKDHKVAIQSILDILVHGEYGVLESMDEIKAVGHRVVHGGQKFAQSVLITPEVLENFRAIQDLAPLHDPPNIMGIEAAQAVLPKVPHAAVLDTAWHQTMPAKAYTYAVPHQWYAIHGVRRYGFHGTSFLYTSKRAAAILGKKPSQTNLIIAHVGNGASMCAIEKGVSVDTSMGLTPLEGLIMGTRSGDIDPAIINFICKKEGLSAAEVETQLNKKSGILGITTQYIDRRDMNKAADNGDELSILAREMECYRLRKYIGAYIAVLGQVDAIVFTAGVGEMSPVIREKTLAGLENLGIKLDPVRNALSHTRDAETLISADDSPIKVFVIPTDEELVMTEDTVALMEGTYKPHMAFEYSFAASDYVNKQRAEALEAKLKEKPELKEIVIS